MANRRGFSPQQIADTAYYPEDENRAAERQRLSENNWIDWYNENVSPDAIRKSTFAYAKQNGMSDADAMREANHAASTATRTGYTAEAASMAPVLGAGYNLGREAVNTARAMSGARAAEAVAPKMLALPAPRSGPSSQMGRGTTGEPIPMGRPPVNPKEDYRQTVNADYNVKPRIPYDRNPVIDQTFVPREQVRTVNEVQGRPTSSQRLNAESPRQDVRLGEAQAGKRKELTWQNLMDDMRADTDGMAQKLARPDMPQVSNSPLVKLAEAKVAGRTLTPAEVGGSESPFLTRPAPGVKRRPVAEVAPVEPAPATVRETQMAPAEYPVRSQFGVADEPSMMSFQDLQRARGAFAGPEVSPLVGQRQRIASQISAEETRRLAEQQLMAQRQRLSGAIDEASMARPTEGGPLLPPSRGGPIIGAMGPIGAGAAVTALGLGSQSVQDDRARQAAMERQRIDDLDAAGGAEYRAAMQQPFAGADFFAPASQRSVSPGYTVDDQSAAGLPDINGGSLERAVPAAGSRSPTAIGSDAVNAARQIAAAKAQAPVGGKSTFNKGQPIDLTSGASSAPTNGPLSSIGNFFRNNYDYNNMSQRQLNDLASGGNKYAEVMAAKKGAEDYRPTDNRDQASSATSEFARGGAAPTKEALLHKSLEIIHHMVRNR